MPRFPDADSLSYRRPTTTRSPGIPGAPAPLPSAATEAGEVLGATVDKLEAKEQEREKFNLARAKSYVLQESLKAEESLNDNDYSTYEKRYGESMAKVREQALGMVQDKRVRGYLELEVNDDIARGNARLKSAASAMEKKVGWASAQETLERNKEAYLRATDDSTRAQLLNSSHLLLDTAEARGYVTEAASYKRKYAEDLATSRAEALTPARRAELLKPSATDNGQNIFGETGTWVDSIPLDRRIALYEGARREHQSELRSSLEPVIRDAIAEAQATGKTEIMPKRGALIEAYGSERADVIWQKYEKAAQFGEAFSAIALMPANEMNDFVEARRPRGEGFADEESAYSALVSAAGERRKQVEKDAMGYVQRNVPAVQEAFSRLTPESPDSDLQIAIDEGLIAQANLGVPQYQRKVLPLGAADQIIGQMSTGTPQERLQQAASLKNQYGEHWPAVYSDLVKAGLPDATAVMLRMDNPMQATPAAKLAEAEATGMKNLEAAVGDKDDIKSIKETVASGLSDYFGTVVVQPGNGAEVSRMTNAATALAYQYSIEGKSAGDAAKQAVSDIVGKKYATFGTVRIPYQYNPDSVEKGIRTIMRPSIMKSVMQGLGDVEMNMAGSLIGTPEDIQKEEYIRMVAESGYLVTNPNESGVYVFDQTGHTVMINRGGQIEPLQIMFKDLEALGNGR